MNVLDGNGEHDGVVDHICHIQESVAGGNFEHFIVVVVVVLAVLHHYVIGCFYREVEIVEATVANQGHLSGYAEVECVEFAVVYNGKLHIEVGPMDVGILHVGEELLVEVILEIMSACAKAFEWQFECRKFSHLRNG